MNRCDRCGGVSGKDRSVFFALRIPVPGLPGTARVVGVPRIVRSCCSAVLRDTTYTRAADESRERGEYVPEREDTKC